MKPVHFVDTTLRDGHMSLWAGAMRTDMMLPVAAQIDQVGFKAMEIISTSFFKKMVRELRDDPWERLRLIADLAPPDPTARDSRALRGGIRIHPSLGHR